MIHVHRDSAGDNVISFDAFKLVRKGGYSATGWELHSLTPWAQEMIIRHGNKIPPQDRPLWIRGGNDRIIGVRFDTRTEALEFAAAVEKTMEQYK